MQCTNPTCIDGCPAHNNIKEIIRLAKEESFDDAYSEICKTSTLSEICSVVCPYEKQCEGHCVKNKLGNPVKIHEIEQYVSHNANTNIKKCNSNGFKVALIGTGPASLACAESLINDGFKCTFYDKYDVPGGILAYGIPDFVLNKEIDFTPNPKLFCTNAAYFLIAKIEPKALVFNPATTLSSNLQILQKRIGNKFIDTGMQEENALIVAASYGTKNHSYVFINSSFDFIPAFCGGFGTFPGYSLS